ncbi:hypothetical protein DDE18_15770 [Nocardioides gansuensis]|uniref:AAA+ ATPase domain-containing protein n=1 Tax=Nocardioides gansuensis TaxID=2138300 RepID=A0A2T8F8U0_9ACTN|nr:AAA family ATPase [Nocardioides gansuensis]PVG82132.1 hypothetical protein DDE18_15770 [Nocardioides gansuensis]
MRLSKLVIHGYRKLVDTECRFSGKLTAIVGPNEAGKSTLLEALLSVQNDDEIPPSAYPYGQTVAKESAALEVWYRLTDEDVRALGELDSDIVPAFYVVTKTYEGRRSHRTHPHIQRRTQPRQAAIAAVARYATTSSARSLDRTDDGDGTGDALDQVQNLLENRALDSTVSNEEWQLVDELAAELARPEISARGRQASEALADWWKQMREESPSDVALKMLDAREPLFAMFGDSERNLRSSYDIGDVADDPPAALHNMAQLAGLDLRSLRDAYLGNDPGAVATATESADQALKERVNEAWKQSDVVVRMPLDGGTLHLLVKTDAPRYNRVAEHSDGLKTFVALTAFAYGLQNAGVPLVLLIDEAEQHLHYDAQADLVRMLERQQVADQVVFSTHSAGCLPSDLGTGIRGVAPMEGQGRSKVTNSLWQIGPGFTPLLMALGAGAAAFAPSRYAVLGEGATEMLLLPTLIREALNVDEQLDYQVAAGLAEVANSDLRDLELEAPRVVYAVDGDAGGDAHVTRLRAAGVPPDRIVQLGGPGSGLTVEDLLKEDLYLRAINEVLTQLGSPQLLKKADLNVGQTRGAATRSWCRNAGSPEPSKPAVAVALLELAEDTKLLTRDGGRVLKAMHQALIAGLGIHPAP